MTLKTMYMTSVAFMVNGCNDLGSPGGSPSEMTIGSPSGSLTATQLARLMTNADQSEHEEYFACLQMTNTKGQT